jgi:hypothetical protein
MRNVSPEAGAVVHRKAWLPLRRTLGIGSRLLGRYYAALWSKAIWVLRKPIAAAVWYCCADIIGRAAPIPVP